MKRKINIICVLILAVIVCSSLSSLYFMGYGFGAGWQAGMETDADNYDVTSLGNDYVFIPEQNTLIKGGDTLLLASGQKARFIPLSGYVLREDAKGSDMSQGMFITSVKVTSFVYIGVLVLVILALVDFIRFIVAINRNHIFEHRNVRFLNRVGVYMLVVAALRVICGVVQEYVYAPFIPKFEGYNVALNWSLPVSEILIGLLALLMAQIWLRAVTLREEQELTI